MMNIIDAKKVGANAYLNGCSPASLRYHVPSGATELEKQAIIAGYNEMKTLDAQTRPLAKDHPND